MPRLDHADHDRRAASLMVDAIAAGAVDPATGVRRLLLVDELTDAVSAELLRCRNRRPSFATWNRFAVGADFGMAEPVPGVFDAAMVRLSGNRERGAMALELTAARMNAGGTLWVFGANKEGIRSVGRRLPPLFEGVETVDTRRRCRLLRATRSDAPARSTLAEFLLPGRDGLPSAGPGVFAKGALDPATALLIGALDDLPAPSSVLDFACGIGAIASAAARAWPEARIYGLDADAVAVEAAQRALPGASFASADGKHPSCWRQTRPYPESLSPKPWDLILSNPPIHRGRELDLSVVHALIDGAPAQLSPGGRLVLVIQRQRPVADRLGRVLRGVRILAEDNRFRVWSAQR